MDRDQGTRAGRPALRTREQADRLVLAVLRDHASSLLRVARRHSFCDDDAQDAYQRAVEIFLRHSARLDALEAHKWIHTVVKHEAMRLRGQRSRVVGDEDVDFDGQEAGRLPTPDEQVASFDRMTRSAEALARLKPQEVRALWLKAQGHSYQEIADLEGWTYTKVNRCLTEGRRSFLDRYAEIGSGAECRRWESVLSALADGEASPRDLAAVRPHLRNCPACRAHVRELRESMRRVAALLPVPVTVEVADHGGLLARIHDIVFGHLQERVVLTATKLQTGVEAAMPAKLAVVAASAAAIGGGVAVERAATRPPAKVKLQQSAAARPVRAAVTPVVVPEPHPPRRAVPTRRSAPKSATRRVVVRRTTKTEFGLSHGAKTASNDSTAVREFSSASSSPAATATATAAPAPAPIAASKGAPKAERTAAAEFGG